MILAGAGAFLCIYSRGMTLAYRQLIMDETNFSSTRRSDRR